MKMLAKVIAGFALLGCLTCKDNPEDRVSDKDPTTTTPVPVPSNWDGRSDWQDSPLTFKDIPL